MPTCRFIGDETVLGSTKDQPTADEIATLKVVASGALLTNVSSNHLKRLRELKLIESSLSGVPVVSAEGRKVLNRNRR